MRQLGTIGIVILAFACCAFARDVNYAQFANVIRDQIEHRRGDQIALGLTPVLSPTDSLILKLDSALTAYRFGEVDGLLAALARIGADTTADARELRYKWLFIRDDLRAVDSLTQIDLAYNPFDGVAWTVRGELMYRLLDYDSALACFGRVHLPEKDTLEVGGYERFWTDVVNSRADDAIHGIGRVYQKQNRFQESLDTLSLLFNEHTLDSDVLFDVGYSLIFLGRTSEAIDVFEAILNWDERHEKAHYFLGNGFTRLNYTQLAEKYPLAVADSNAIEALQPALDLYAQGKLDEARQVALIVAVAMSFPTGVKPWTLLASIDWVQGRMDDAAEGFRVALRYYPEYGRAHAGLAKALEGMRMRQSVHRARAEAIFAATPTPKVPRIEEYILNWHSLSPRHQKQVALSVQPWKTYLPVLVESGSGHYIKPLHELLSECPGLETIRDQRIEYDSRLWDDVRGCGGFTTVTGVEDVERSIYFGYNTVLHELTHQVHGVFPPDDLQRIADAFHAARAREDGDTVTFMSQYQQASVWEYFAEGANAYYTPRRDEYDTRDIVRERLLERDPRLLETVEYYLRAPNLEACYAIGLCNASDNEQEKQELERALEFAERARARDPLAERALSTLSHVHSLRDEDKLATGNADAMISSYPNKAESYVRSAEARFCTNGDAEECIKILGQGLARADSTERKRVRRELGRYLWHAGRYGEAAEHYRAILREVRDDPGGLWGLGVVLGDAGNVEAADSAFREAIARRSGVVELRLAYARFLIRANRLDVADAQITEAELLAPTDPEVRTMRAWLMFEKYQAASVVDTLKEVVQELPEFRFAAVLLMHVQRKLDLEIDPEFAAIVTAMAETDVPIWVFVPRKASYEIMCTWPRWQREMLE
ncbi:tetratricopeptide repeat protein, partial [bacterium]|nr:tetratricopeptide repeat protein [bacterium]